MPEHLRQRATPYPLLTSTHPPGYGGVEPSPSLALLDDARSIAVVAPPRICPHGAGNAAHWGLSTGC